MKNEIIYLKLATVTRYVDKYFLTFLKINALFVYDSKSKRLVYLNSFQSEQLNYCLYFRSFLYKDEIWFLPGEAKKVAIFNTNNMQIEYLTVNVESEYCIAEVKYNNFVRLNNNYICFVPRGVNKAIIINMETKRVVKYYDLSKKNEEFQNAVLIDNTLHFYPWHGDQRVSLDLLSGKINRKEWNGNENFGDAVYDKVSGNIFHAPARKNYVLIDNLFGKIVDKKVLNIPVNKAGYHSFFSSYYNEDILFWGVNGYIKIKPKEHSIHYIQIREDSDGEILVPIDFLSKESFVFGGNEIFEYDSIQKKYISIEITITFEELITQIKKLGKNFCDLYGNKKHGIEAENQPLTLNEYIYLIN